MVWVVAAASRAMRPARSHLAPERLGRLSVYRRTVQMRPGVLSTAPPVGRPIDLLVGQAVPIIGGMRQALERHARPCVKRSRIPPLA